jgi:hypothetical protein
MLFAGVAQQQANNRNVGDTTSFMFTVDTLGDTDFQIPSPNNDYRFSWYEVSTPSNNGTDLVANSSTHNIEFGSDGIFHVSIDIINAGVTSNNFDEFLFNNSGDRLKMLTIEQWGTAVWADVAGAFYGCANLTVPATDAPNLTVVTRLKNMFRSATLANPNVLNWDTSNITDTYAMFLRAEAANPNTSLWDTSSFGDVRYMFKFAYDYDRYSDIANWNITSMDDADNFLRLHTVPTSTYNDILIAFDAQSVVSSVPFDAGNSQASGAGATARANLISDHAWTFSDVAP